MGTEISYIVAIAVLLGELNYVIAMPRTKHPARLVQGPRTAASGTLTRTPDPSHRPPRVTGGAAATLGAPLLRPSTRPVTGSKRRTLELPTQGVVRPGRVLRIGAEAEVARRRVRVAEHALQGVAVIDAVGSPHLG